MFLGRVISSSLDKAGRRIIKWWRYSKQDAQTSLQMNPFGVDSCPPADAVVLSDDTQSVRDCVAMGYANVNQKAGIGEVRLYAIDSNGDVKFELWLKKDGSIEIGGSNDNSVRFVPLKDAMDKLANDINTELSKIQTGITTAGGSYTPSNISIDISGAKIDEIKTL